MTNTSVLIGARAAGNTTVRPCANQRNGLPRSATLVARQAQWRLDQTAGRENRPCRRTKEHRACGSRRPRNNGAASRRMETRTLVVSRESHWRGMGLEAPVFTCLNDRIARRPACDVLYENLMHHLPSTFAS